jgi:YbbR domain-containing protein
VTITGDPRVLEPVQMVTTEPVNVAETHDFSRDVAVLPPPGVTSGVRVHVSVQIVPAVAVTVLRGVRVRVLDAPAGTTVVLVPGTIEVHVQGPVLLVTRLRAEQFTATVEAGDLPIGQHRLPVKVTVPAQVELLDVHPAEILVTIRRGG